SSEPYVLTRRRGVSPSALDGSDHQRTDDRCRGTRPPRIRADKAIPECLGHLIRRCLRPRRSNVPREMQTGEQKSLWPNGVEGDGPLRGVKVIDAATLLAGPMVATILG